MWLSSGIRMCRVWFSGELFSYVGMGITRGNKPPFCVLLACRWIPLHPQSTGAGQLQSPLPVRLPPSMATISSPLRWHEWQISLAKHPDEFFAQFVVKGIKEGFRISYDYWSQARNNSTVNMP